MLSKIALATIVSALLGCGAARANGEPVRVTTTASPPLAIEARTLLGELVAIDTSKGDETKGLAPVIARLKNDGLSYELVESAPGRGNLVARIKGNGKKRPLLLLAHIDVVPTEGQPWTVPPYAMTERGAFLLGRGVSDDKSQVAMFTTIFLELAREKTPRSRDVVLALTAGEETGGAGMHYLMEHRRELLDAEVALNEGGGLVTTEDLKAVIAANISSAEKLSQTWRLVVKGNGGHSSVPPVADDPAVTLAKAILRVGELRFSAHVLPEARENLLDIASRAPAELAAALRRTAQSGTISPDDERVLSNDRTANAALRTTCVTTMLQGSPASNALPTTMEASVNCRILPDETREGTKAALTRAIDDARVTMESSSLVPADASRSPIAGDVPTAFARVVKMKFPHAAVHSTMSLGATDSRHLRPFGTAAYGIGVWPSSIEEVRKFGAHNADERRPVATFDEGFDFVRELVREIAK